MYGHSLIRRSCIRWNIHTSLVCELILSKAFYIYAELYLILGHLCDTNGHFRHPDTPPLPWTEVSPTDWFPYISRLQFETAEFLYRHTKMSQMNINTLLDLWATLLLEYRSFPLLANPSHLYSLIDATPLGDTSWTFFSSSYQGEMPNNSPL